MFRYDRLLIVAVVAVFSSATQAVIINVPGDQPTIQAGINAAVDGDEVVVAPGTYRELINFNGKAITVRSTDPNDPVVVMATIIHGDIDGDGTGDGTVVTCNSGEGSDTVLSGFTITGGTGTFLLKDFVGGGMFNLFSSPTVTNCTFSGNSATFGGGMYNFASNMTVINCTFAGNSVTAGGSGAGMGNDNSVVICTNCRFIENNGQGIVDFLGATSVVVNCTFSQNDVGISSGSSTVTNCTFSGNGTGVFVFPDITMANCVFWDNDVQIADFRNAATVSYSDVQGGWPGPGNIDADPLFVDPINSDLRLSPGSPCIDAGDNTAVPIDIETDLDGNPRFLEIPETPDTGNGTLPIVDMGAYESLGGGCLAVTSQEVVCHADGTTFTVNFEGLNACTGGTSMFTFTGSGGAVGEEMCFTVLVNDPGFCCSTQICVTIPDCSPPAQAGCPWDCAFPANGTIDVMDFFEVLAQWSLVGTSCDFKGNGVDVVDFFGVLANWGPCP